MSATGTLASPMPPTAPGPLRVLICDDSATVRAAIARLLESDPNIRVVAQARHGEEALTELRRHPAEILILDIEMPVMDGLTALPLLLRAQPGLQVLISSTMTSRGADTAIRALRLGAADYLAKPGVDGTTEERFTLDLLTKIRTMGRRLRTAMVPGQPPTVLRTAGAQPPMLLAIGSSTGGPQALFTLVQGLAEPTAVPVVITQHMPPAFTTMLAQHIGRIGIMPCVEATDHMPLEPGRIHLAPGDRHLLIERSGGSARPTLSARLSSDPPENFCRPAVDPMLRSASASCGGRVLVVMLTGMGHDGLAGTRHVIDRGGTALAQDEASSVVWGMPGAIAQAGLCHAVLSLPALAVRVRELLASSR